MVLSVISTLAVKAQVPLLSSYPSASATIFLDFDGHTVSGTSWNWAGPISMAGSGLTSAQITEVFNRIAEDYRPFNINVTTDSTKFLAAPLTKRMRVIFTISSSWYGNGAGGVSYVNSFTWGDDTPCFVFTALLLYSPKYISEAGAHEAGHTLGLYHQSLYDANCVKTNEYNTGQGSGETSWAPIMGIGYYKNVTTWYTGTSSTSCSTIQNDMAVIIAHNGLTYRTDDYTSTFNSAANLSFSNAQFQSSGMIEQSGDQDMFKFTVPSLQKFHLDANPYNVGSGDAGSNLDMQVSLYNNSQTLIKTYSQANSLSAVIDTNLNQGNYYLKVEPIGNQYLPSYASLGSYSLLAQLSPPVVLALRKLELHGETNGDKHQLNWLIDADEKITAQVLEISTDGQNFSPLIQSPDNVRSFVYKPYVTTTAQYRLNVTFDNGRQYYSNTVTLRQTGAVPRPQLVSNLIFSNNIIVSSPGNYTYTIIDFNGKVLSKGQLSNGVNNINAPAASGGIYLIRFANNTEQWMDKFVKQ